MTELIIKISKVVHIKKLNLERRKNRLEVYLNEADNYYAILSLVIGIKTWEDCLQLITKYFDNREKVTDLHRSSEIETILETNKKYNSSYITERDKIEILEYIRTLEWKVESLKNMKKNSKFSWLNKKMDR